MVRVPLLEPLAQRPDLVEQLAVFERLLDQDFEPDRVDRLEQVVVRAELHRLDGRVDRGVPGHHDRRDGQVALADLADQVEAVDPGQAEVGDDQREVPLDEPLQGGGPVVGDLDPAVGQGEQLRELLTDQLAVVHHKDASIHGALIQG